MSTAPSPVPARRRADAQRNRDRIIATAHLAFIRHGIGVPMEEIARGAEVGVGTLYRHFADREALLRAVIAAGLERLMTVSRQETDHATDPWGALCRFVRRCVELRLGGSLSALRPRMAQAMKEIAELADARQRMIELLEPLVRGAQSRGDMRRDVSTGDVIILIGMLVRHECEMTEDKEWITRRHVEIVLDGLRPGGHDLPGPSVDLTDFHHD